jgi:hypothetical protein
MKLAWAILCSLFLAGTMFLPAQTLMPPCAKHKLPACCQHGNVMPCCTARPSSTSQPPPAVPTQTANQYQLSLIAVAFAAWVQPVQNESFPPSSKLGPLTVTGASLCARHCVWII